MPRRQPFVNVSAVVSPAIAEEISRLAAANKTSRSTMVRQLLEERLTQRQNERTEDAFEQMEKRLARMEERFAKLMVKAAKASAQNLYLQMHYLEEFTELEKEDVQKWWVASRAYGAKYVQSKEKEEEQT